MAFASPSLPEPPSGRFDGRVHRFALRAYYEDTDLSGVVYHANYLRWFERARSDMLRLLGIDQRAVHEAGGGAWAVAELTIRYQAPARLDDAVVVESSIEELRAVSCWMRQRALRVDAGSEPALLSEMRVRVGFVAADGRPHRQPATWHKAIAAIAPPEPTPSETSA